MSEIAPQSPEKVLPPEKTLPAEFIKPFAVALENHIADPLNQIETAQSQNTEELEKDFDIKDYLENTKAGIDEIKDLISSMKSAKEVKIVPFGTQWRLTFAEELQTSQESEDINKYLDNLTTAVALDSNSVGPFTQALRHHINNSIAMPIGYGEMITMSANSDQARQQGKIIEQNGRDIVTRAEPIFNSGSISVAKGEDGKPEIILQEAMKLPGVPAKGTY